MNLAWANPLMGIREQTATASMEEMEKEARWRVWNDLQNEDLRHENDRGDCVGSIVFRQEPIEAIRWAPERTL